MKMTDKEKLKQIESAIKHLKKFIALSEYKTPGIYANCCIKNIERILKN